MKALLDDAGSSNLGLLDIGLLNKAAVRVAERIGLQEHMELGRTEPSHKKRNFSQCTVVVSHSDHRYQFLWSFDVIWAIA